MCYVKRSLCFYIVLFLVICWRFYYLCWDRLCSLLLLQMWLCFQIMVVLTQGTERRLCDWRFILGLPLLTFPVWNFLPWWWADDFPFSLDLLNLRDARFFCEHFEIVAFHSNGHLNNLGCLISFFIDGEQDPNLNLNLHWRASVHCKTCHPNKLMLYFMIKILGLVGILSNSAKIIVWSLKMHMFKYVSIWRLIFSG